MGRVGECFRRKCLLLALSPDTLLWFRSSDERVPHLANFAW
jgi:hypothetical protein